MAGATLGPTTPFLTIWMRPRATIRRIVDSDPTRHVLLLAGTCYVLVTFIQQRWLKVVPAKNLQPRNYFLNGMFVQWLVGLYNPTGVWLSRGAEIVTLVVLGAVLGIVLLYVNGAILKWTGRLFGGTATSLEVRAAIAWGQIPFIIALVFAIFAFQPGPSAPCSNCGFRFLLGLGCVVVFFWGFVSLINCAAEVHRVSAWRGLGAVVLWLWSIPLVLIAIALTAHWLAAGVHAVS